jgi:phage protein D
VKRRRRKASASKTKTPEAKQGDYLIGTDENVLVLSRTYANRRNAERAAKAAWERLQRGVASFSSGWRWGEDLFPELPVKVSGFKQQIDEADWIITTVTNSINDNGFTTSLELEVKISDTDMN